MAKQELYAIGILFEGNKIKYVTSLGEHKTAHWSAGEEAMYFTKDWAKDMCIGFAWNGYTAIPILKQDFITLSNPPKEENE